MNDRARFSPLSADAQAEQAWLPLSDAQRAVWMDMRLGADPLAYALAGRVSFNGEVDLDMLRQSLRVLIARHDALRLRVDQELPRQRLVDAGPLPFFLHDLPADLSPEAAEAAAETYLAQRVAEALPLGDAPLLRVDLVRISPLRSELLWRFNHLIADATTIVIAVGRWAQTYAALTAEVPSDLPPGSSFVDTLAADAAYAQSDQAEADLAHWRRRYDDVPAPILSRLPGGPRAPMAARRWAMVGADYSQWRAACAKAGVTEQRALVALLALAVGTRHDVRDLSVGMALHRRDRHSQQVIGMLAAAMPVRCQWRADASLRDVVRGLSDQLDVDYRHQRAPMDAIGRALGLGQRGQGGLFDVSISYTLDHGMGDVTQAGLSIRAFERIVPAAIVPLPLLVVDNPTAQSLSFDLGCNPDFATEAEADGVVDLLQRTIAQFMGQANAPVAELEPASAAERARVLDEFNPAPTPYPEAMLHTLVRAQAAATPEAVAVIDGDLQLSYADLDARSERLARRLRAAVSASPSGASAPEPVVAVALPRSAATIVALLAILKAGAVYLPLDTAYPTARLQYMLDDIGVALLIDEAGANSATAGLNAPRLDGDVMADLDAAADVVLPSAVAPDRLAYVIYTSGSTGLPKPVGVSHRAAVNLDHARQVHDPLAVGDRVLAAISVGFDVSIGQLLLPLLRGAAIVVAPPLRTLEADQFWALLARHGVNHINSVPSFFDTVSEALAAQPEAQRYRGLKRLMLGGEALTGAMATKLQLRLPGTQIVNMYGPTETCIDATAYVVPDADAGALPAALPIGQPLPNYRAYVLDTLGRMAPLGVVGELCIAGPALARGYLGRPFATAEKFVADPFGADVGEPGARMYRTGDLARWTDDGQIEFLGRNDQQVKIRGHRIETGEIEAVLLQHEAVMQVVVIARKDANGMAHLVAYLVRQASVTDDALPDAATLKTWLVSHMPDHMVPSALLWLPALPLTTNGKLDIKALPLPDAQSQGRGEVVAPVGDVEITLAALWTELLRVPQVGRHDEFFALGGHSLLAITLVERLRQAGLHLSVPSVFAQPRLCDMALACQCEAQAAVLVPPLGVPADAEQITPEMLPMVTLSQTQIDAVCAQVPGGAAQVQDIFPLAPLQEGMLFHHLMQPVGDVYMTPVIMGFRGLGDIEYFVAALRRVIARHDILRTSFAWEGLPAPVQVVWRSVDLPLEVLPAPSEPVDALAELKALLDPERERLDLRRAPLMRTVAMEDAANGRWLLGMTMHHLTLDHTSVGLVMAEVAAIQRGQSPVLTPSVPWRDLLWQVLHGQPASAHEAFFREMLSDVRSTTTPFGLAQVQGHAKGVDEAVLNLPSTLSSELRAAARAQGVSAASLMHLAWGLVLAVTHGDESADALPDVVVGGSLRRPSVVFGTVMLGRLTAGPGVEQALGMLINTLPVRVDVGGVSVANALQDTHQRLMQLMHHEHASLALAQACSGVAAPAPLFTSVFNYRQKPPVAARRGAGGFELLEAQERTGYPLTLCVDDDGHGFSLVVQSVQPAEPARVARLVVQSVEQLIRALQSAPQTPCHALNLMPVEERVQVLDGWNATDVAYPVGDCLHTLFEAQVARTPDAVAVVAEGRSLTYAQLNVEANRLAHRLVALGVQPDSFVGLALERSCEMVVAILATHKAGGAYVPLDPDYPADRLTHMLQDCTPRVLLTQAQVLPVIEPLLGTLDGVVPQVLVLGAAEEPWSAESERNPTPAALGLTAQHLAYLIYTSGSTGKPKGVMVEHAAVVNRIQWMQAAYGLQADEPVLQKTPFSFDVSVWEFFWPLLYGARLVMARPQGHKDPAYLCEVIQQQHITTLHFVPSMLQVFLDDARSSHCLGLVRVVCSGEALSSALCERFFHALPQAELHNLYGPTEAAVDVSYHACVPGGEHLPGAPIGRPIANTRLYVLDSQLQPVPVGVPGELFIGGVQVARGYLNRPDLTAERFMVDPHAVAAGHASARMYKTGDLARWMPHGEIEYLGRNDHQVKIRGLRIELGEIEAALLSHPGVREAVVVARADDAADATSRRLVGYYSVQPGAVGEAVTLGALRAHLAQDLPDYMVPSALVSLPALPLSPNGKIDRAALPAPDALLSAVAPYVAPRDALETALQAAWQTVFARSPIGLDDDFFALGGHSLLAIRLISECQTALHGAGVSAALERLNLRALLAQPTLRAMAQALRKAPETASSAVLVPLRAQGSRTPLFCVHPHNGMVWCYLDLVRALDAEVPIYGLQARGLEAGEAPHTSVEAMAADYLQALRDVQPHGPYQLLGYSAGGVIAYEMAARLRAAGETVSLLSLLDAPLPDGADLADPSQQEVLDDAGRMMGLAGDSDSAGGHSPRNTADLLAAMVARGLTAPGSTEASAQRLIDVARAVVGASRRYRPQPLDQDLLQLRALRRDTPSPDWSVLLPRPATTHDLDVDHLGIVAAQTVPELVRLIAPRLA